MAKLRTNLPKDYKSTKKGLSPVKKAVLIYRILLYISFLINFFLLYELHKFMK
jgi:hypothetical protein